MNYKSKSGDTLSQIAQRYGTSVNALMKANPQIKNAKPQFIGSNNVNSDGSRKITLSSMNYPIMAVHQYRG
ncbi:MAG: LysM peptidoglycan-binding domain-containing protein [Myxococcaceae bacterium]|nr:LysM peptidoglycan-binding domain-containing protein [Myxococcaceae bacterium]